MKTEKTPAYLKQNIETIISDARKNITVHYTDKRSVTGSRFTTGCHIIDHNDYSIYFYEPTKFEIISPEAIKCVDQRTAHQNGIIALKRWELEIRNFLSKPTRKMDFVYARENAPIIRRIPVTKNNILTTTFQEKKINASKVQRIQLGRSIVIR